MSRTKSKVVYSRLLVWVRVICARVPVDGRVGEELCFEGHFAQHKKVPQPPLNPPQN